MNRKVTIRNLNVTNYPLVEDYLSKMAKKGWMIKRIIANSIFIFKKIESKDLDFSITPYEIETFMDRKTKKDLKEFQEVTESIGWKYATKSNEYHIYYKRSDEDLIALQTDMEEEFESIKKIAKRELKGAYSLIVMFSLLLWFNIKSFDLIEILESNTFLFIIPMIIFVLIVSILQVIVYKIFLNKNKKNIELGNKLEFSNSNIQGKIIGSFLIGGLIFAGLFFMDEIYKFIKYKDITILYSFLPLIIGLSLGTIFRYIIKPIKISKSNKFIYFMVIIALTFIITIIIVANTEDEPTSEIKEKNSSILIPESYHYYSGWHTNSKIVNRHNTLNEDIARLVVDYYINSRKDEIEGIKEYVKDMMRDEIESFDFPLELDRSYILSNITMDEYSDLKSSIDTKESDDIVKEIIDNNIIKGDNDIWDADEVYYLSNNKTIAIVRYGDEVYYFRGFNFSNDDKIREVKHAYIFDIK